MQLRHRGHHFALPLVQLILTKKNTLLLVLFNTFLGAMHLYALRVLATATCLVRWLGGWLAVRHSRYCIKMTKLILKLFRPSGSPIIEAFETHYADTKFQGEPHQRGR